MLKEISISSFCPTSNISFGFKVWDLVASTSKDKAGGVYVTLQASSSGFLKYKPVTAPPHIKTSAMTSADS